MDTTSTINDIDEQIDICVKARDAITGAKEREWYSNVLTALYSYRGYIKWRKDSKNVFSRNERLKMEDDNCRAEESSVTAIGNIVKMVMPVTMSTELINYHTTQVEGLIRQVAKQARRDAIDEFCMKHNLCDTCITGGYNCGSDHK